MGLMEKLCEAFLPGDPTAWKIAYEGAAMKGHLFTPESWPEKPNVKLPKDATLEEGIDAQEYIEGAR